MITCYKWSRTLRVFLWGAIGLSSLVALLMGLAARQARADQARRAPSADTFVASGRPTENFDLNRSLWVGHDQAGGYLEERALLGFNADLPVGSTIASAKLWLYLSGTTTGDAPLAVQAYRVRSGWAESSTWNDHLGLVVDGAPAASVSVPAALGWYAWDVTAALQAWSDARDTADFSLLLRSDVASGQHERGFWSRDCSPADCGSDRPYLEIAYDLPTATPTATLPPTPTPTPTPLPLKVTLDQSSLPDDRLLYVIVVFNPSTQLATSLEVTSTLPSGVTFVAASKPYTLVGSPPHHVKWNQTSLAPGKTWSVNYTVQLPASALSAVGLVGADTSTLPLGQGTVNGYVVIDADNSGAKETGDPGVPNVPVQLVRIVNQQNWDFNTAPDGYYFFDQLAPGDYTVGITVPPGKRLPPTSTKTPTVTPTPSWTPTPTRTPTRTPAPTATSTPRPPVVYNTGACVSWQYPGQTPSSTCSSGVFLNPLRVWLPLVIRN